MFLEYAITLTTADNQKQDYDKCIKNLLNSLRKTAKNKEWEYKITVAKSNFDAKKGKRVRLHYHIYVLGNPATSIIRYIKQYWETREYGNAKYIEKVRNTEGYLIYIKLQSSNIWEQTNMENNKEQQTEIYNNLDTNDDVRTFENQGSNNIKNDILVYINIINNINRVDKVIIGNRKIEKNRVNLHKQICLIVKMCKSPPISKNFYNLKRNLSIYA